MTKTIIITGASSGIGKAATKAFLAQGDNVIANARNADRLGQLADECKSSALLTVAADISHIETTKKLVTQAMNTFGRVDVLINNAGTFTPKPFLEETVASLDSYYATTVKGSFFLSQAAIPIMQQQHDGVIINLGSMWVDNPIEATPSSASQVAKGAMHTLTRHLAIEFAKDNIRVNTVAPAVIETPLYDTLMDKDSLRALSALHPLRRTGQLEDIIPWLTHLAGSGSQFVTGQTIFVDGGITAGSHSA